MKKLMILAVIVLSCSNLGADVSDFAAKGDLEQVKKAFEAGVSRIIAEDALFEATKNKKHDVMRYLLLEKNVLPVGIMGWRHHFGSAVRNNDLRAAEMLVDAGGEWGISTAITLGEGAIPEEFVMGKPEYKEMAKLLKDARAKYEKGYKLIEAVKKIGPGSLQKVKSLFESGVVPGHASRALAHAVRNKAHDIIKYLLDNKVNPNRFVSVHGVSMLGWAVADDNLEAARMLIAAGADPYAKDDKNRTVMQMAQEKNSPKMINLLAEGVAMKMVERLKRDLAKAKKS